MYASATSSLSLFNLYVASYICIIFDQTNDENNVHFYILNEFNMKFGRKKMKKIEFISLIQFFSLFYSICFFLIFSINETTLSDTDTHKSTTAPLDCNRNVTTQLDDKLSTDSVERIGVESKGETTAHGRASEGSREKQSIRIP